MHELPPTNVTILEALDVLCSVNDEHGLWQAFSRAGRERLRNAGAVLTSLRSRAGQLSDLVRQVESELLLDIELVANESAHPGRGEKARANIDAFIDLVDNFIAIDDEGTLASLLAWLDRAVREDSVAEQTTEPNPNAVQLMTVHGSKGLEWDYVVVPRLVTDEFPSQPKGLGGWLSVGELPFELRGDANSQPELAWRSVATKMEFKTAEGEFREAMRAHLANEERRLIYVALTRARDELFLTGSFWSSQTKPRGPSVYLNELADAGLVDELPSIDAATAQPAQREGATLQWPIDPLGSRGTSVRAAAQAVSDAQSGMTSSDSGRLRQTYPEIGLLLAERDRAQAPSVLVAPERVNASSFKDFVTQPEAALQKLRRPMPEKPYRQAKIGTLFHQWVERRYSTAGGTADELTADDFEWADDSVEAVTADTQLAVGDTLEALKAAFEASPWGDRRPIELEREITVPFAGRRLVCKLDAVYENADGSVEIVDWKTGKAPTNDTEKELRLLQLELYRHAYAAWRNIDPDSVSCVLFYVASGEIVRASAAVPLAELEARWLAVFDET
jgi:DNA helicase-2/ATP-dependent DNA helicase PcrA